MTNEFKEKKNEPHDVVLEKLIFHYALENSWCIQLLYISHSALKKQKHYLESAKYKREKHYLSVYLLCREKYDL